ncbi:MAG: hypothetical protein OXJ62_11760 [Spirochaetaceae bacterium]|nr:hypothetical protein [Spirochaetaceae bacterium]
MLNRCFTKVHAGAASGFPAALSTHAAFTIVHFKTEATHGITTVVVLAVSFAWQVM